MCLEGIYCAPHRRSFILGGLVPNDTFVPVVPDQGTPLHTWPRHSFPNPPTHHPSSSTVLALWASKAFCLSLGSLAAYPVALRTSIALRDKLLTGFEAIDNTLQRVGRCGWAIRRGKGVHRCTRARHVVFSNVFQGSSVPRFDKFIDIFISVFEFFEFWQGGRNRKHGDI